MTTTPHHVGQLAKARILIADTLERHTTEPRDPADVATWLLEQLQAYGWRPPFDPAADTPPLRPDRAASDDSPGRRAFQEARAELAARRANR